MKHAHPAAESLELYAKLRGEGATEEVIEKHLLVCERCSSRVERIEQKIVLMQTAFAAKLAMRAI